MEFGCLLRIARTRSGKSARKVEAEIGLPHGYISRWENARLTGVYPRGETIGKLKHALNLSPQWEHALELAAILELLARFSFHNGVRESIVRSAYECTEAFAEEQRLSQQEPYLQLIKYHLDRGKQNLIERCDIVFRLGIVLSMLGQIRDALAEFAEAQRLAREAQDPFREMLASDHMGVMLRVLQRRPDAFQLHQRAGIYWKSRRRSHQTLLANCLRNQGQSVIGLGHDDQICALFRESMEVALQGDELVQHRLSLCELARHYACTDRFQDASAAFEQLDQTPRLKSYLFQETIMEIDRLAARTYMGDIEDPGPAGRKLLALCEEKEYGGQAKVLRTLMEGKGKADAKRSAKAVLEL